MSGVFQWCGREPMTKYQMVQTMSEVFNLPMVNLKPDKTPSSGAPRPHDTTMMTDKVDLLGAGVHTPFRDGIKACLLKWSK